MSANFSFVLGMYTCVHLPHPRFSSRPPPTPLPSQRHHLATLHSNTLSLPPANKALIRTTNLGCFSRLGVQVLAEGVGRCGLASGLAGWSLLLSIFLYFPYMLSFLLNYLHVLSVPLKHKICLSLHLNSFIFLLIRACFQYVPLPLPHPAFFITPHSRVPLLISIPFCLFLSFVSALVTFIYTISTVLLMWFQHFHLICLLSLPDSPSNQSFSPISFLPSFLFSQFPRWSSRSTFPRLPSANWCTLPAWWHLETCPYASRGARMARRSFLPRASLSTQRSSWAPSRYPRCRSNTMATTPASPATMLPPSAQRGNSQWLVSLE